MLALEFPPAICLCLPIREATVRVRAFWGQICPVTIFGIAGLHLDMARQFTGIWPGVAILAAALCSAPHAPAQEESSGVRVLPSRRFYPPPSGSEDTAAPQGPVGISARRKGDNGTAPAAATPTATTTPTSDTPKPAPAPAQPQAHDTPAADAPPALLPAVIEQQRARLAVAQHDAHLGENPQRGVVDGLNLVC